MKKSSNLKENQNLLKKRIINLLVVFIWILIWEGISLLIDQELLVPSPFQVFLKLFRLMGTVAFWQITVVTVTRIIIGFVLGSVLGVLFAILTTISPVVNAFFKPLLSMIKATPVASFIILALVWIQGGQIPAFISFLMVFPIIWGNVVKGISQTDNKLLEMAKVYHIKKSEIVRKIYINSVLPFFVPAAMTSMGLAWKAGIAAEVLSTPRYAIGTAMYDAKIYLETVDLFAWSIVVIIISVLLEKVVVFMLKKLLPEKMD